MDKKIIIRLHLVFWGLVLFILAVSCLSGMADDDPMVVFRGYFIRIFFRLFIFYVFYIAFPQKSYGKKQIFIFIVSGLVFIGLTSLLFNYLFLNTLSYLNNRSYDSAYYKFMYFELLFSNFVYAVIGALFRAAKEWYNKSRNQAVLERQNISNKLTLLKAQVNPHFLFNTLNNINSFIQTDPDKASASMNKLSGIMQYMLYDAGSEKVSFEQDIKLIKNYIDLQKIRHASPDFIKFNINGNFTGISLQPLLFMPFIENAFKHGRKQNKNPGIIINFLLKNGFIYFDIVNYVSEKKEFQSQKGGFGLQNIRSRLELIFGNNYKLDIADNDETFSVKLQIKYA